MSKLKLDDYTMTTIEIYLNNDNPHHANEMVEFLAKKYGLYLGLSPTEPYETIETRSGSARFPEPPESELARENRRLRENYQSVVFSQATLRSITGKILLSRILILAFLAFVLFCAVQIWIAIR